MTAVDSTPHAWDVRDVPGWAPQARLLVTLLGVSRQPAPSAILVHAPHSGRSAHELVHLTLRDWLQRRTDAAVASVSPYTSYTAPMFFTHTVRQLGCDEHLREFGAFLASLRRLAQRRRLDQLVLVIHGAERMRGLWPGSLWEALPRLAELTKLQGRLTLLFLSPQPWSAFRTVSGSTISVNPIALRLPRLGRNDMLALLHNDFDPRCSAAVRPHAADVSEELLRALYRNYCVLLYDSVKGSLRSEDEIRVLCAAVWRALSVPVYLGKAPSLAPLRAAFSELVRDAMAHLLPYTDAPAEWAQSREHSMLRQALGQAPGAAPSEKSEVCVPCIRTGFGVMSAYLLIAAFLASYNPIKTDVKYYVRELGTGRRRRRRRTKAQTAMDAGLDEVEGEREIWNRPQFWGPRSFHLERLLAIYHALLRDFAQDLSEEALPATAERAALERGSDRVLHNEHIAGEFWSRSATALGQLNELVEQKLVVRMSPAGKLGAVQYRVNAPHAYVLSVAEQVGFPLQEWLWDWHK